MPQAIVEPSGNFFAHPVNYNRTLRCATLGNVQTAAAIGARQLPDGLRPKIVFKGFKQLTDGHT